MRTYKIKIKGKKTVTVVGVNLSDACHRNGISMADVESIVEFHLGESRISDFWFFVAWLSAIIGSTPLFLQAGGVQMPLWSLCISVVFIIAGMGYVYVEGMIASSSSTCWADESTEYVVMIKREELRALILRALLIASDEEDFKFLDGVSRKDIALNRIVSMRYGEWKKELEIPSTE